MTLLAVSSQQSTVNKFSCRLPTGYCGCLNFLWCFCRGCSPLPIPNRVVKPLMADGTGLRPGRVGRCHIHWTPTIYFVGVFLCPKLCIHRLLLMYSLPYSLFFVPYFLFHRIIRSCKKVSNNSIKYYIKFKSISKQESTFEIHLKKIKTTWENW